MAFDERLADRVRQVLSRKREVEEKRMMGGLTFMVKGKMCVGILKDELMCRIDPDIHDHALRRKGCREMDFTGRAMRGFVFVGPQGTHTANELKYWIGLSMEFNRKIKTPKKRKTNRDSQSRQ